MCGICGSVELSGSLVEPGLVEAMTERIAHRGPDDAAVWQGGMAALGHTRLSLLDLGGGKQPMGNETGEVMVAFNGEIYNFESLRAELQAKGHVFRTRADTEVIPHAWEEWGAACVERLRGMFAFALWDARTRTLLLARDRLGIKPLYWAMDGTRILFASELKSIFASARLPRRLDAEALHDYLSLLVPLAPRTMFAGVSSLEPGTLLLLQDGRITQRRYWEPSVAIDDSLDEATALERLEALLPEVLRDQVVADVPVGAFLSGGIDSSLLVSFLAPARSEPLQTFTIGFEDRASDEGPFARAVAERFHTDHHELRVAADHAPDALLRGVLDQFDQPFADSSAIPTWLVSRETRKHVKTVISGDGGDELFGGYTAYRVAAQLGSLRRLPGLARAALGEAAELLRAAPPSRIADAGRRLGKALAIAGLEMGEALCALRSYFDEPGKAALYHPDQARRVNGYRTADRFAEPARGQRDFPSALAACDLRHRLAADMLQKVDMMSMSHGLEVRVPLLDERVVDLALSLPTRLKLRGGVTKILLRKAAARRLPSAIVDKPKSGFVIPLRQAAGPAMGRLLEETIERPSPRLGGVLRTETLHQYAKAFRGIGPSPGDISGWQLEQRVYALAALDRWMQRWDVGV